MALRLADIGALGDQQFDDLRMVHFRRNEQRCYARLVGRVVAVRLVVEQQGSDLRTAAIGGRVERR